MSNSMVIENTAIKLAKDYGDATYPYNSKSQYFYVINTTKRRDDLRITRGRICVPVMSDDGRTEVMVNIPNTFIPINIAQNVSAKELRRNPQIRNLIARGLITPIPDDLAITILSSSGGLKEQDRISAIEDELIRSQVEATQAGDDATRTEGEQITRNDINQDSEQEESISFGELGLKGTKGAKIQVEKAKKKSSTSKKINQLMLQLNEERNEKEVLKTLDSMKLKERHYMSILKQADKKFKAVRQYALSQLA